MLAGNGHQTQQSAAESNCRSSSSSHSTSSTPTYPHAPPSATAGTPIVPADPRASGGYGPQNFPQYPVTYAHPPHSIPVPVARANAHAFPFAQPPIRQPFPNQQHMPPHLHGTPPYV